MNQLIDQLQIDAHQNCPPRYLGLGYQGSSSTTDVVLKLLSKNNPTSVLHNGVPSFESAFGQRPL